jgi:2-polyprenyl-6-methoxyphenol hydroxylase-like FAD-dependent oxidoreductase
MTRTPVLIVGGGPVGLFLAIELASRQVPCILVNAGPTTALHPAGNTHNTRTMEHYRRLGLAARVRQLGLPYAHATDVAYRTRVLGTELARLPMPSTREKLTNRTAADSLGPEPLHRASQMLVEALLRQHVSTLPGVQLRFGWKLLSFEETPDGVTARLATTARCARRSASL